MAAYELAVAQTLHLGIGEGMSCGLINTLANTLGSLYVFFLTFWLQQDTESASETVMVVLVINVSLALILIGVSRCLKYRKERMDA